MNKEIDRLIEDSKVLKLEGWEIFDYEDTGERRTYPTPIVVRWIKGFDLLRKAIKVVKELKEENEKQKSIKR